MVPPIMPVKILKKGSADAEPFMRFYWPNRNFSTTCATPSLSLVSVI